MTKREAEKTACFHAALIIDCAIGSAEELDGLVYDTPEWHQVMSGMEEMVGELLWRSGRDPCKEDS